MQNQKNHETILRLTTAALCVALGLLLPSAFHVFGQAAGRTLLPMHLPVLLCGLLCGWRAGGVCGLVTPLLSSALTSMPPIYPTGAAMALELCAYGLLCGLFYQKLRWRLVPSLVLAMLGGRAVSGIANAVFMGMAGKPYGFEIFLSGAFVTAWPGILLQLVAVPLLVVALQKARLFRSPEKI